ncbi:MAG: LptF/LptG family permease [Pseudomonadota bacterium]
MKRARQYFAALFLARWFVTTFALLALLSIVDSIGAADILPDGTGASGTLWYMALRLPSLYDRVFMFALFISLLVTLLSLIRRQELVGFVSMSVSPLMQAKALVPAVLLVTVASVVVIDQALPRTMSAIENWLGVGAFLEEDAGKPRSLWIAEEETFIEIGSQRGNTLFNLVVYHRAGRGMISAITYAETAVYVGDGWRYGAAETVPLREGASAPQTKWETTLSPLSLQKLGTSPRNLSMADQYRLSQFRGSGVRPSSAYRVWLLDRMTMPIAAIGFVFVSVPLMQQFGRRQTGDRRLIMGIAIAFGYFILDGVLKTVAEGGGVSVMVAVGLPLLLLAGLGIHLNLNAERVR